MAVVKVYDQDKTEQGELTLTPEDLLWRGIFP